MYQKEVFLTGLERINEYKKEANVTNEELALLSGVPKSTIDKITAGKTCDPKLETVKAIVKALGKTLDDLDDDANANLNADQYTQDEKQLLHDYQSLSEQGKEFIRQTMFAAVTAYKKDHRVADVETSEEIG